MGNSSQKPKNEQESKNQKLVKKESSFFDFIMILFSIFFLLEFFSELFEWNSKQKRKKQQTIKQSDKVNEQSIEIEKSEHNGNLFSYLMDFVTNICQDG